MIAADSIGAAEQTARRTTTVPTSLLALAACLYIVSDTVVDPDLWGHLRFGLDTIAARNIVTTDPYSFMTAGSSWVNHEWLSEVIFALAYLAGGPALMALLKTLLALSVSGLLLHEQLRYGIPPIRAMVPVVLAAAVGHATTATVRPHIFTYMFFAFTIWVITRREAGANRTLWLLPPVFAVWANAHGGFLAGVCILLVWLAADTARVLVKEHFRIGRAARALLPDYLPVAVSVLATLANPYVTGLWLFLLRTATTPRPEITEWAPVSLASPLGLLYSAVVVIASVSLVRGHRAVSFPTLAVFCVVAALPLIAARHTSLAAVALVLISAPHLQAALVRLFANRTVRPPQVLQIALVVASAMLILASMPRALNVLTRPEFFGAPSKAIALLGNTTSSARLAVDFDWGEYAIWHLGPRILVSLDGRRETVYSETAYQQGLNFMFGTNDWDAVIDEAGADVALVKRGSATYNLLTLKPGWRPVFEDELSGLFVAQDSVIGTELRTIPIPESLPKGATSAFP